MKKYITGKWINDTLGLNAAHALYREDGIWYHHLERFPGILFDSNGYLIVNNLDEYNNHPAFRITKALSVKNGISQINDYIHYTAEQKRLLLIEDIISDIVTEEEATRKLREVEVLVRKRKMVEEIKVLYQNTCQLCNTSLKIRDRISYSEIHHIKPLGRPHNGPDIKENAICVCPNCHVQLDLGAIKINLKDILVTNHTILEKYVTYHNTVIYNYTLKPRVRG